jgi:hypothetical protein
LRAFRESFFGNLSHQGHHQGQTLAKSNHILSDVVTICFGKQKKRTAVRFFWFYCSVVFIVPLLRRSSIQSFRYFPRSFMDLSL